MKKCIIFILSTSLLIACASQPEKIQKQSVSPLIYKDHNCNQIAMEMERINNRIYNLYVSLKKKADHDAAQAVVGCACFLPTLLLLEGGDGPEAIEYSRLKGEREALEKIAIQKECDPKLLPTFVDYEEKYRKKQEEIQRQFEQDEKDRLRKRENQ